MTGPDELNYSALRLLWDIAQSAAVLALFIWTVIDRKRQSNTEGYQSVNGRTPDHGPTCTETRRQPWQTAHP